MLQNLYFLRLEIFVHAFYTTDTVYIDLSILDKSVTCRQGVRGVRCTPKESPKKVLNLPPNLSSIYLNLY